MVLIPAKNEFKAYYGNLIDAIKAFKPIVAPNAQFASDLCKKDAGIFLYDSTASKEESIEGIYSNCSIIAESPEIREILQKQNANLSDTYDKSFVYNQFTNIIKRLKNN